MPAQLQEKVEALGEHFDGRVGIAIRSVSNGWMAGYRAALLAPQQSVSKLWVAIAVLDAVDRGRMTLSDPVLVRKDDLTVFHQPISVRVGRDGYSTTIYELIRLSLINSDNTANDVLLQRIGGPEAVRIMLASKGLDEIAFGPGERALQSAIAGLAWRQEYAEGRAFRQARARLTSAQRESALSDYLAVPPDAATPDGIVQALTALQRGELLSRASTLLLLDLMASSETGKLRLRAGLAPGWRLAHKTGTGQELGLRATAFNDVGILTGPSGRSYAIAVMIADTMQPIGKRQQLIADVARSVVEYDEGQSNEAYTSEELASMVRQ